MKYLTTLWMLIFFHLSMQAHVELDYPKGGEMLQAGDMITIKWHNVIQHNIEHWELQISLDGGTNWDILQTDIDGSQLEYDWTIPNINSNSVRIKVIQVNTGTDYESQSADFTVVGGIVNTKKPLLIPALLSGQNIDLTLQQSQFEFYTGTSTATLGVNGNILGPTLLLQKGQFVDIKVDNQIGERTTIHWHGMHVSAANDGGPHTVIEPGTVWNPQFNVLDKAATYWYHPHLHMKTNDHVLQGLAGFIIVQDEEEAALNLPRTYGVDDIPIAVQTKTFTQDKQIVLGENALDTVVLANATRNATVQLPAQVVRLRLLNGASQRIFNFGMSDNRTFYQIASDGGLLEKPVQLTRLMLVPGERAEILVDLSQMNGQKLNLMSYASEIPRGYYGAAQVGMNAMMRIPGYEDNPLNGSDFEVLELDVIAPTDQAVTSIPTDLVTLSPWDQAQTNETRTLVFTPETFGPSNMVNGPFVINGAGFDIDVINYEIPLNNVEIWEIRNQSMIAHPFHIHDVQFYILDRNGTPVPLNERGRKDVVIVPPMNGTVRFITKFETFADDEIPYMYHCHMLTHEDAGMMGQFTVVDTTTSTEDQLLTGVSLSPNPTNDLIKIDLPQSGTIMRLYDASGKLLQEVKSSRLQEIIHLGDYPVGMYLLHLIAGDRYATFKVIKE